MHTRLCWGDVMETGNLEDLDVDGRIILKRILKKWDEVYAVCLGIGTGGGLL